MVELGDRARFLKQSVQVVLNVSRYPIQAEGLQRHDLLQHLVFGPIDFAEGTFPDHFLDRVTVGHFVTGTKGAMHDTHRRFAIDAEFFFLPGFVGHDAVILNRKDLRTKLFRNRPAPILSEESLWDRTAEFDALLAIPDSFEART